VFLSHAKPRSRDEDKGKEDGGMSCRFAAIHAAASSRNGHKGAILTVPIAVDCRRLLSIAVDCCRLLSIAVDCRRLLSIAVDCQEAPPVPGVPSNWLLSMGDRLPCRRLKISLGIPNVQNVLILPPARLPAGVRAFIHSLVETSGDADSI